MKKDHKALLKVKRYDGNQTMKTQPVWDEANLKCQTLLKPKRCREKNLKRVTFSLTWKGRVFKTLWKGFEAKERISFGSNWKRKVGL